MADKNEKKQKPSAETTANNTTSTNGHDIPVIEELSDEELRQYFLYLTNEKKASRSACTIALCALKFLHEQTLKQEWPTLSFVRPPRERKLPVILSVEEVHQLLGCLRQLHYRACLSTIYSCGLRLQEGVRL